MNSMNGQNETINDEQKEEEIQSNVIVKFPLKDDEEQKEMENIEDAENTNSSLASSTQNGNINGNDNVTDVVKEEENMLSTGNESVLSPVYKRPKDDTSNIAVSVM